MAGLLAFLMCLQTWTWWSRYPLIAVRQGTLAEIQGLANEVSRLESKWSSEQAKRDNIASELKLAYQSLFEGDPNASSWSAQIENSPEALSFIVRSEKVLAHPVYTEQLVVLPTVWTVKGPSENDNCLEDLLAFLRDLTTKQSKWIEVVGLLIGGNELTQTRAEFSLRLWFKKESVS